MCVRVHAKGKASEVGRSGTLTLALALALGM